CQQAESLSKLSAEFKAVPIASLQAWNNLRQGTGAKAGSRLIVGYLKVKTSLSQLATSARNVMPVAEAKEPGAADETAQQTDNVLSSPKTDKKQVQSTSDNSVSTVTESKTADRRITTTSHGSGGFFIADYTESRKTANGTAGTFKSTSGWSDGKYYALMNNVQVGTIVKVIAPATQKSIYAKVLGQLPDMKESEGLTIRISNAAANELGEPEGKFSVQVRY
ncbi:MAG TPA: hypothetical protein VKR32_12675, partial [Puia sp.]|nr:hypothetical protein [Puia sp.]